MRRPRKYIPLPELLASALADRLSQEQRDDLRARHVPAKTVIALFSPDHNHLHALGGSDKWWNLTHILREPHKQKSRRDTSIVAKVKRIERAPGKWKLLGLKTANYLRDGTWPKRKMQSASRWPKRRFKK